MNLTDLRELISDLNASPITAFEVDTVDLKLKLSWQRTGAPPDGIHDVDSMLVRSPLAGVFSLTTGDGPEIAVGDSVEPGRALCSIDHDGVVNVIEAETAGKLAAIHAKAGEQVKAGQVLFEIGA